MRRIGSPGLGDAAQALLDIVELAADLVGEAGGEIDGGGCAAAFQRLALVALRRVAPGPGEDGEASGDAHDGNGGEDAPWVASPHFPDHPACIVSTG